MPGLTRVDWTMERMRLTNVSEVLWQGHGRWACQDHMRAGPGGVPLRANNRAPAGMEEHA
jgi:hypothetical protein